MEINLTGISAAENNGSSFKMVQPGVQTLTISKIEEATAGDKAVLQVTFDSTEAEASFNHRFFLTEKALPRVQYLIEKFTGKPLEGSFSVPALSAILVGKSKSCVVDGEVRPREKDGKVYNNTYATLRFAGFVEPEGKEVEPRIDSSRAVDTSSLTSGTANSSEEDDSGLPF